MHRDRSEVTTAVMAEALRALRIVAALRAEYAKLDADAAALAPRIEKLDRRLAAVERDAIAKGYNDVPDWITKLR